jgi:hypothetical protein
MSNSFDQPSEIEPHYTVGEVAKQWHLADATVRRLFAYEPGVLTIGAGSRLVRGPGQKYKRRYFTLRIPRSVFLRVQESLIQKPRPAVLDRGAADKFIGAGQGGLHAS